MNGYTALNQANWLPTVDVEQLKCVRNEPLGNRHKPISHGEAVEMFLQKADDLNMNIITSAGFLSPETDKYIFICETEMTDHSVYNVGFVNFNDRSRSFTGLMGERLNLWNSNCFSGVFQPSRTRHTLNVGDRLGGKIDSIFNQYTANVERMKSAMGFLTKVEINDANLGNILVNLHRSRVMGATNLTRIIEEYDNSINEKVNDLPSNGLKVYGSFTEVLKRIKNPIQNIDTGYDGRKIILDSLGY